MADQRITELTELAQTGVAGNDVLPISDISSSETKKITVTSLIGAGINLSTSVIDLNKLDQNSSTKIGTVAIADDAITYAKIQDVSSGDRLLGRTTGLGPVEEIVCTAAGRTFLAGATAATQRATLELGPTATVTFGTVTANLVANTASISSATITGGTITGITDLAVADGGTGASTPSAARTNLGVEIGTDVQAYDAGLQSIASLTTGANQSIYLTAANTYDTYTLTQAGRNLLDDADAPAQRNTLGLGTLATQSGTFSGTSSGTNTGDQTITLTGAVTGSGTGTFTTTLSTGAVQTSKVGDNQITYAKIQDVSSTDRVLGRSSAGSGDVEEITCTAAGRAILGASSAVDQRTVLGLGAVATLDAISGSQITDLSVGTNDLAENSVTASKLNLNAQDLSGTLITNGTIETDKLATASISTSKVSDSAITYAKIQDTSTSNVIIGRSSTGAGAVEEIPCTAAGRALIDDADSSAQRTTLGLGTLSTLNTVDASTITDGSVGTAELADASVTINKLSLAAQDIVGSFIADGGIDTQQLAAGAVETNKIADSAVTYTKIQDLSSTDLLLGRSTTGAGSVEEIPCTAAGRALLDDADDAAQRTTLGLGTLATQDGTFSGTHSGTSSGTNTGDQTIILTGPVTGTGTGTFATSITSGAIGTNEIASDAVTYDRIQDTTSSDVVLGRSTAGGGTIEQIACTAAGRALIADASASDQRSTLGLGNLATATGTWTNGSSFSGTSSGTNTGDQTITLTGAVTGSGTGSFATTLASDIVAASNIQTSAVTTAKINDSAIDEDKLGDQSTCIVSNATPSGSGAFVGQGWFNTGTSIVYRWDGTSWAQESGIQSVTVTDSTPLSVVVNNPDAFTANITLTLDTQQANTVFVGPSTGADAAPSFRALVPADLPNATASTNGIVRPGTGLSVSAGQLDHTNVVAGGTKSGITFDNQGHITAAVDLVESDIPDLDASKITTGTLDADRIAANSITAAKLADRSTASIGSTLPIASFTGQIHFNPLDKNFFLWDGNVWQSIGISAGAIILAGTYDASTNQIASVTNEGSAIGLTVGNALPSSSTTNSNYYVVVSELGTGTSPAPTVSLAPPDLLLSTGTEWLEIDVSSTYTAQTANNVAFSPAASLGSTNVQAALEEVSNECRDADNITSGALDVDHGGTNITSYTKGDLLAATATTTLGKLAVGTNGYILSANSSETTGLEWIENATGTVTQVSVSAPLNVTNPSTTPTLTIDNGTTSAVGVVQLTDGVASSSTTTAATPNGVKTAYDLAAAAMPKTGGTFTGEIHVGYNGSLVFEGPTDNALETTLTLADPTADRTITLPDATGTVALTSQLDDGTYG